MRNPIVSVVVCTAGSARFLEQTLASVKQSALASGTAVELVLVDNNEAPRHAVAAAGFEGSAFVHEPERGLSPARNAGMARTNGDVVAFTDDDVVVSPEWIRELVHAFAETGADAVQGRIVLRLLATPPPWFGDEMGEALAQRDCGTETRPYGGNLVGANMAFRRQVFERVGGFDCRLGPGRSGFGDDTEYGLRTRSAGCRLAYAGNAAVLHQIPPERLKKGYFRRRFFLQGRSEALVYGSESLGWVVALYSIRVAAALRRMLLQRMAGDQPAAFARECAIYRRLGFLTAVLAGQVAPREVARSRRELAALVGV